MCHCHFNKYVQVGVSMSLIIRAGWGVAVTYNTCRLGCRCMCSPSEKSVRNSWTTPSICTSGRKQQLVTFLRINKFLKKWEAWFERITMKRAFIIFDTEDFPINPRVFCNRLCGRKNRTWTFQMVSELNHIIKPVTFFSRCENFNTPFGA